MPEEKELSDLLRVEARGQPLKSLRCRSMSIIAGQVAAESLKGILSWRTTSSRLTFSKVSRCGSQLVGVEHMTSRTVAFPTEHFGERIPRAAHLRGCHGVSHEASVKILAEAAASEGLTWAEAIVK